MMLKKHKKVFKKGRSIRGTDKNYIIETFPDYTLEFPVYCEVCFKDINKLIRVYKSEEDFNVKFQIVCSVCCEKYFS